jgi:hypothetical protein
MRQVVVERFRGWSAQFEGEVPWMYLDVKGLVTVAVGNLIDPLSEALKLPFVGADGKPVDAQTITNNWHAVKAHQECARLGYRYARQFTAIQLTDDGIASLVAERLVGNWAFMRSHYFPAADSWPAPAQLAVSSLAWALGAGWPVIFKACGASAKRQDWMACADQCAIKGGGSIIRRNAATAALFRLAATQTPDMYDTLGLG